MPNTSLWKAAEETVAELRAASIRCTMDVRNLNLPCILITPPSFVGDISCGGTATFTAWAISRGPGNADAWKSIDALLEQLAAVVDVEAVTTSQYTVDDTGALPALEIVWTKALSWP